MAEQGPRCTRRKQANPRRKNVELENMPEDTELDPLGPAPSASLSPSTVSQHGVRETADLSGPEAPPSDMELRPGPIKRELPSSSPHLTCPTTVLQRASPRRDQPPPPSAPEKQVPMSLINGHAPHGAQVKKEVSRPLPNGLVTRSEEEHSKTEEEKIREYLERSDTAVIFPEPVDGESVRKAAGSTDGAKILSEYLKCPQCDNVFTGAQALTALGDHLESSHPDGSTEQKAEAKCWSCTKCSATFAQKEQLEKHELLHSSSVQRHMISHDESTVLRKFKCPECGKAFKFKHHLKEHIRIHSGEKPFACPNCGKRFSHSGSYSSHMTSKKCLVMNLKVRKMDTKSPRGRGSNHNNVFRPIIPKYGVGGECVRTASYLPTSERLPNFEYPPPRQPPSVVQPFLPTPYASLPFHPLLASHFQSSGLPPPYMSLAGFHDVSHILYASSHQDAPPQRPEVLETSAPQGDAASPAATTTTTTTTTTSTTPPTGGTLSSSPVRTLAVPSNYLVPEEEEESVIPPEQSVLSSLAVGEHRDLNAVKKILEIVDATVNKQQQELGGGSKSTRNGLLPELLSATPATRQSVIAMCLERTTNHAEEKGGLNIKTESYCRFCEEYFDSKIELHQHERYLCAMNRDRPPLEAETFKGSEGEDTKRLVEVKQEPPPYENHKGSSRDGDYSFHSLTESDEDIGREEMPLDARKISLRTVIEDEHLHILKAHYENNPRVKKFEIIRLAKELGYPPRLLQMWFQRVRTQDRRFQHPFQEVGIPSAEDKMGATARHPPVPSPPAASSAVSSKYKTYPSLTPPFSPVFPQYNGSITSHRHPPLSAHKGSPPTTTPCGMTPIQLQCLTPYRGYGRPDILHPHIEDCEQPLDLSVKHKHKISGSLNFSPMSVDTECEVLNLSQKSSRTSTPLKDTSSMVAGSDSEAFSGSRQIEPSSCDLKLESSTLYRYMQTEGLVSHGGHLPSYSRSSSPAQEFENHSGPLVIEDKDTDKDDRVCDYRPLPLVIHPPTGLDLSPHSMEGLRPPSTSNATSREDPDSPGCASVALDNKESSPIPDDLENQMDSDNSDIKRMRKLPWKQMDDENQSAFESSPGPEDDVSKRKKPCLKPKAESEEGSYTCDQCEKTFSKQSSLARHKYEHSGQRPHKCDVCNKAFKHKHHLTEHKRLHSGEKPFQCKKCLKRFSHSGSYSQHMNHRYSYCKPYRQ